LTRYSRDGLGCAGLGTPPEIASDAPGRRFRLHADSLGSVDQGSPVSYRGLRVGQVLGYTRRTAERVTGRRRAGSEFSSDAVVSGANRLSRSAYWRTPARGGHRVSVHDCRESHVSREEAK